MRDFDRLGAFHGEQHAILTCGHEKYLGAVEVVGNPVLCPTCL